MNRNQKIALGCGGAGCLGLIVVAVACVVAYLLMGYGGGSRASNRNYNFNVNSNSNRSSSTNLNENENGNDNTDSSSSSSSSPTSSSPSVSSLSNDDKHKLFQAASNSGDPAFLRKVLVKIGLLNSDYTPTADYSEFMSEHVTWATHNVDFMSSISDSEKAREYADAHLPE